MYSNVNYDRGLAAYFMKRSHFALDKIKSRPFYEKVLEIGAGEVPHLIFGDFKFSSYSALDREVILNKHPSIEYYSGDACTVDMFSKGSFDRIIACNILEHLESPHLVLEKWWDLLKKGGELSLILPCDPGMMWRLGRTLGPRKASVRQGIDYDYWMAREHVNPIGNLLSFVRYYFPTNRTEMFYPFGVKSYDLNLFYICTIVK